uniref:Uncharacterized protein n=1 Tax=Arundo donax TaxID=35708 RepID=A0A0A8Z457_ARUDO
MTASWTRGAVIFFSSFQFMPTGDCCRVALEVGGGVVAGKDDGGCRGMVMTGSRGGCADALGDLDEMGDCGFLGDLGARVLMCMEILDARGEMAVFGGDQGATVLLRVSNISVHCCG